MSQINLHIDKRMFTPKFYPLLFDYTNRWEVYVGSAGSSKSWFITQKLIIKALNEPRRILVCRRYGSTIRQTVFDTFKQVLNSFKINQFIKINEGDYRIKFPNDSEIIFTGLDDECKLLSLSNISDIFVEEAFECNKDIVEQLNLRMRGKASNQQIFIAYNPISKNSWLYDFVEVNPPQSFLRIHSTYKDNPFLNQAYIDSLEDLRRTNPSKARIFCDGEYGVNPEGLVYTNWTSEEFDVMEIAKEFEHRAGADLGFQDPTAIVDTFYDEKNRTIYIANEFYKTGQTLDEVYKAIINMNLQKSRIWMDNNEPRVIDFMRRNYLNVKPAIKGQGSVQARILFLQNHKIIVYPSCTNVIRELENFSYIKSKKTGEYTDDTTHEFSHSLDALGYAYSDVYTNNKIKTFNKSLLGL